MLQLRARIAVCMSVICFLFVPALVLHGAVGGEIQGTKPVEDKFFQNGGKQFTRVWGMQEGVGPVFTDGACGRCHKEGFPGGSSARLLTFFGKINPDQTFDPLDGTGASHENEGGLLLQPRSNQAFRQDCPQAGEVIPADANAVELRAAPSTFGFGLIDAIDDQALKDQERFEKDNYSGDNIHGQAAVWTTYYATAVNKVGRFGRKAQMANLIEMTAFAFAHDLGITNPIFQVEDLPQGQPIDAHCTDNTNTPNNPNTGSGGNGIFPLSHFMRYLAPPTPNSCDPNNDCGQGQTVFTTIGCDKCHKQSYTTKASYQVQTDLSGTPFPSAALSSQTVNLYSDLLLHDLGTIDQGVIPPGYANTGVATQSQWRTTPLWGLQVRTHFLHDGRATTLDGAIRGHSDGATGEAVSVINNYVALSDADRTALLHFLKTL